ncbi:PIN domain-containing protein [Rhizobium phaseoli]|uniref:PIN domain-containing protein n=1 Tax=Rhizobium phaseoli TaxID=396 RepID=UPI001FED9101|nr:PIN domain-containing protein [Rhizobium phaseoli]
MREANVRGYEWLFAEEATESYFSSRATILLEANVVNYRPLIEDLKRPDLDDRHVLAAAIVGKASTIVTWDLKDFPRRELRPYGVTSRSPDDFLADLHITFPEALLSSARLARLNLRKTTPTVEGFVDALPQNGLKKFARGKTRQGPRSPAPS